MRPPGFLLFIIATCPVCAADITVDFDSYAAIPFAPGTPVPAEARFDGELQNDFGLTFGSTLNWVAVVDLGPGHATSGNNGIAGVNADNVVDYGAPIQVIFTYPRHPVTLQATTDFVSIRTDLLGGGPPISLRAYDLAGNLIASDSQPDSGGAALTVRAPAIHRVVFQGNGGVGLDDLTFATLKPTREIIDFEGLQGSDFVAGTAIPDPSKLTRQYANRGVLFTSAAGYAGIVNLGINHAYSGTNGISASTPTGAVTYAPEWSIDIDFVSPTNSSLPAVTDFVAVSVDRTHTDGTGQFRMEAYGVDGALRPFGVATKTDSEDSSLLSFLSSSGISKLRLFGSGATAFDDLIFNPPRVTQPILDIQRVDPGNLRVLWPATFQAYTLQFATDLAISDWNDFPESPSPDNAGHLFVPVSSDAARLFFRLTFR